jgi:hypothetical protein
MFTAANVQDSTVYEELVDTIPPIKGKKDRPRKRSDKLHADKDYYPRCHRSLVHPQERFWVMSCSGAYEALAERNHKVLFGNAHKARLSIAQKVA